MTDTFKHHLELLVACVIYGTVGIYMHGFTLDAGGKKMSKSLGNVVSPIDVIDKYGADTLRAYVLSSSAPWDDLKFNQEEVENVHRSINILWNVFRFPLPYMALDNFDPLKVSLDSVKDALREEDRWILSRVQSVVKAVDEAMSGYFLHKAVREILEFTLEDLSRWYIQLIRPRTWTEADDPDKLAAYCVLYEIYVTLTKLISPFMLRQRRRRLVGRRLLRAIARPIAEC